MAGYVPWYGKKRACLVEHEKKFATLLQTTTEPDRLAEGAEIIRAAHVRALRASKACLAPKE